MPALTPLVRATALDKCSVDMTLILGAESFLECPAGYQPDPHARSLLVDLVDLLVNAKDCYISLPAEKGAYPRLAYALERSLSPLRKAASPLASPPESELRSRFLQLARPRNQVLRQWVQFQTTNPIVTSGHYLRIGGLSSEAVEECRIVTDEALRSWRNSRKFRDTINSQMGDIWSGLPLPVQYRAVASRFKSVTDFLLCYAYDVFRRGWQYQAACAAAGATYVPHGIRDAALSVNSASWCRLAEESRSYWSWGDYLLNCLDEDGFNHLRAVDAFANLVAQLRTAVSSMPSCQWIAIPSEGELTGARARELAEMLDAIARQADLTTLWTRPTRGTKAALAGVEGLWKLALFKLAGVPAATTGSVKACVRWLRPAIDPRTAAVEVSSRNLLQKAVRGQLSRRGLYGPRILRNLAYRDRAPYDAA